MQNTGQKPKAEDAFARGISHNSKKEWAKAKEAFDQAIANDPRNDQAYTQRAYALLGLHNQLAAMADLAMGRKIKTENAVAKAHQQPAAAATIPAAAMNAATAQPAPPKALPLTAKNFQAVIGTDDAARAVDVFAAVVKQSPKSAKAQIDFATACQRYQHQAVLHMQQGHDAKAAKIFRHIISIPATDPFMRVLAHAGLEKIQLRQPAQGVIAPHAPADEKRETLTMCLKACPPPKTGTEFVILAQAQYQMAIQPGNPAAADAYAECAKHIKTVIAKWGPEIFAQSGCLEIILDPKVSKALDDNLSLQGSTADYHKNFQIVLEKIKKDNPGSWREACVQAVTTDTIVGKIAHRSTFRNLATEDLALKDGSLLNHIVKEIQANIDKFSPEQKATLKTALNDTLLKDFGAKPPQFEKLAEALEIQRPILTKASDANDGALPKVPTPGGIN